MNTVKGIVVDDEQLFFFVQRLGKRRGSYHGVHKDFLDGWGGSAVLWPVDQDLLADMKAMKAEGLPVPKVIDGYESEYVSRKAVLKRSGERAIFKGKWGHCVCKLTFCTGHRPLAFFAKKPDAAENERALKKLMKADPAYDPTKMELGGEDDDDDDD